MRTVAKEVPVAIAAFLVMIAIVALPSSAQSTPDLQSFFRQDLGLSQDQIAAIRNGQPVAKTMPSRTPAEVFLVGAGYIHAAPQSYLQFAHNFDRMRKLPNYLALGVFSNPPQLSDLKDFSFDSDDIQALKNCKPGDCLIQMPASSIEEFHRSIDWSAADVNEQVNQFLQKTALQRLLAYQREGNQALGIYNDKPNPTEVPKQFAYMLSYAKALPERLPDFYHYLLNYPNAKPANVEDTFYWARVKFGLKPTLRVVHVVTMHGNPGDQVAYAVAEKQLCIAPFKNWTPAKVIQMLKQRVSRKMRKGKKSGVVGQLEFAFGESPEKLRAFWQARFYDFNVYKSGKVKEKLNYMHANPVVRGLVGHPNEWPWSSWGYWMKGEAGLVAIDSWEG